MQRLFDVLLALVLLPLVIVFLLIICIIILIIDGFFPFYVQERTGMRGRLFKCVKLQTLRPTTDPTMYHDASKDKTRLTCLGIFLRDHGWDEVPQITSILIGDMSFVGPRPLSLIQVDKLKVKYPDKLQLINGWWDKRLQVRPGLGGWHQINLPNHNIIKYDLEYLENPSLSRKFKIFITSLLIFILGKKTYFKTATPETYEYNLEE